jgi:RNA polymerase sigma-70 factor (ECF subfamily)
MAKLLRDQTDEELIGEFQRLNDAAFELLVSRYKDQLTNFAFRFIGDWDDSNDVVQETFVRVFRNRNSYKPVARFSTWIYTIASNVAKTALRRRRLRKVLSFGRRDDVGSDALFDIPDESARADIQAESSLREERIQRAIDSLSTKYREVVVLRDVQELSYEEIAGITGLNIGTVKSRINRGRGQLQEMLKDLWSD